MKKCFHQISIKPLILFFILLIFCFLYVSNSVNASPALIAPPTFTGNAITDMSTLPGVYHITDLTGDVGIDPSMVPQRIGWDMTDAYYYYDISTDKLYVGVHCTFICGDVEGDGNPAAPSAQWLAACGAVACDSDWGTGEIFGALFNMNNAGNYDVIVGKPRSVAGIGSWRGQNTSVTTAGNGGSSAAWNLATIGTFGTGLIGNTTSDLFANHDMEFVIDNFKSTPGYSGGPIGVGLFIGSITDAGNGEDNFANPAATPFSLPAAISGHVKEDTDHNGTGDVCINGTTVELYDSTGTTLLFSTTVQATVAFPVGETCYYEFPPVNPGTYVIKEIQPTGFSNVSTTAGTTTVSGNTGTAGTDIITNVVVISSDISPQNNFVEERPTITINKTVVNNNGGTALASAFQMQLNGANVAQGTATPVSTLTAYTISEIGVPAYSQTSIVCTSNANGAVVAQPVTFSATTTDNDVTCLVTNDDNPAKLTITKVVVNDNGGNFVVGNFGLFDNGGGTWVSGVQQNVNAGSHTISESGAIGYTQTSLICKDDNTGANLGAQPITLALGQSVTCTITNDDQPGHITVNKVVVNNSGGTKVVSDFPLLIGAVGVTSGTSNTENAGTYTVSETLQAGYTESSLVCKDDSNGATVANPVVLALAQNVTCTITNDDNPAHLTVIKSVTNSNGGTKVATDFALFTNATPVTTNTINTLNAGTYTVSETPLAGYTQTSLICKDDVTTLTVPNPVVLALGQSVTCTISNVDIPGTITVNKVVTNNNGGTKIISDFPLFLNGLAVTSGVSNTKVPGTYTVTETNQTGYTQTSIACVNAAGAAVAHPVVLSLGDAIVCTVTNDDNPAHLTITKVVTNTHGGTLAVANFPLLANGAGVTSGVSNVENVGLYTISETQQTGYTQVSIVCIDNATGGSIGTTNGQTKDVTLALGQDVTCTITNADLPVKLTVVKSVVTDNGGTLTPNSVSLFDNALAVVNGTQNTVSAGIHTITETAIAGYTQVGTVCKDDNTGIVQVFPYNFALGQSVTCTITNDDQPAHLTVTKVVVNNSGGTATNASFPLKVGLTTVTSGTSNVENAGTYNVSETQQTGYTQTSFVCIDNATGGTVGVVNGLTKDVTLALNQSVTCTITNDDNPAHLTVIKSVTNSNGGSLNATNFPLTVNGTAVTTNTINTENAGTYTVAETQQPGYLQTSLICKDDVTTLTVANPVVLALGQSVTCTISNADIPAKITVNKVVVNNSGGTKVIANFPLLLAGTAVTSGTSNTKTPGTYLVSETAQAGYTQTSIVCKDDVSGVTVANPVVLALGQAVTCTVTNDDNPAHLTVTKVVTNTHGGALNAGNFPLFSNGTTVTSGTNNTVNAGTYTVTETQQPGYAQSSLICKDDVTTLNVAHPVVLALGQSVTCTLTNVDVPAQLTLTKLVVNDNGGTATAGSFTLSDNATSVTSGVKNPVNAGAHAVTESTLPGYTQTSLVCKDDTTNTVLTTPLNLTLGQTVTCIFTNDDVSPMITVTKVVTNNNGGTKVVSDFPLKVGTTSVTSGVQKAINSGTYSITETGSPDYLATYSGDCNASGSITLNSGDVKVCTITNNDYPNLGDYVWMDTDKNGIQDIVDTGINGVTVNLYCAGSTTVLLTTTTANNPVGGKPGYYQFLHLDPAKCNYIVEFVKPVGSVFTLKDTASTTDLLDSDADLTTGKTIPITMAMDQDQEFWDAGIFTPAQIGDYVWTDANADGIQDVSETGTVCSEGVIVKLTDSAGAKVKDADGVTVADQVTTATGKYLFTNLLAGNYKVTFVPKTGSGCVFTTPDNASATDLLDSDADTTTGSTTTITLLSGQSQLQWDAGLFVPATLGDYVWQDDNADGIQGVSETGSVCSTGVTVKLSNSTGAAVKNVSGVSVADQVTTSTGKYLFTNLLPGNYIVTFVPATGSGCIFTSKDVSTTPDLLDSDADTTTGKTTTISLAAGDNQLQWDAGLYIPAQLGDYVWTDTNADGVQNTTETDTVCRVGVSVKLTDASGNSVKDASGVVVASQVTTSTGLYLFTNLVPGVYKVAFTSASGSHCLFTKMDSGTSDTLDSDADMTSGITTSITLISGDKQSQWDAGLVQSACIGDRIFEDLNANGIEDAGEPGIPNAVVTLLMPDGTKVDQTSDSTGTYGYCNLFPTTYTVSIIKTQSAIVKFPDFGIGYTSTTPDTVTKTLAPNDYYKQADFGYLPYSKVGDQVFIDKNKDCKFDSVDTPVSGVKLNLKDMTGKILQTTTTDVKGIYSFIVPSNLAYTVDVDDSWKQNSAIKTASPTCGLTKTSPTMSPNQFYPDLDFGFINPELPTTGAPISIEFTVGISLLLLTLFLYSKIPSKREVR